MLLLLAAGALTASGQSEGMRRIKGRVADSVSGEGIPLAVVRLEGASSGALADEHGRYAVMIYAGHDSLSFEAMGYEPVTIVVPVDSDGNLDVELTPVGVDLDEVEKRGTRTRYSKRGNPAVEFMKRIRREGAASDPRRRPHYSYDVYERISLALNDFTQSEADSLRGLDKRFGFVREYVDTSEITGKPILNVAVREKASEVAWNEGKRREEIDGFRSVGIDERIDPERLRQFYDEVLGEVDIYEGQIPLLGRSFVSPLSAAAPDLYRFYLGDTLALGADTCVELLFTPRLPGMLGFTGRMFVMKDDPALAVRRIEMEVPDGINLNFVDNLRITQEYATAPDGSRLKLTDDLMIEARPMTGLPGVYARRVIRESSHRFSPLVASPEISSGVVLRPGAAERDSAYWTARRTMSIGRGEERMDELMARLRSNFLFRLAEDVVDVVAGKYITIPHTCLAYGPILNTVGYNTLEGWRFRGGLVTTSRLSRRWFGGGYLAYGLRDHKMKYGLQVEYSFRDKPHLAEDFPVHSIRASADYDVNWLGQEEIQARQQALWFSLRFAPEIQMTYRRRQRLEYKLETPSHFSLSLSLEHQTQEPTRYMTFTDGFGRDLRNFSLSSATLRLSYKAGGKDECSLAHTFAPKGKLGNRHALSLTRLSLGKRIQFPALGHIDTRVSAGHVWTSSPYPLLLIPDANLSYFMGESSFNCLNPLEFINDSYVRLDLSYHAEGWMLNFIPGVRSLRLREVFGFKGLCGHLSSRNDPSRHPSLFAFPEAAHTVRMTSRPYVEAYVGIENILNFFRVDYVWRLTYRDDPYACLGGVRIAVSLSF